MSSCQRRRRSQAWSPSASARFVEPTMSVNMNVFRAVSGPLRRSSASRSSRSDGLDVDPGAEPAELIERGFAAPGRRLPRRPTARSARDSTARAAGDLVRRADLAPALDRRAELAGSRRERRPRRGARGRARRCGRPRGPARVARRRSPPARRPRPVPAPHHRPRSRSPPGPAGAAPAPTVPGLLGDGRVDRAAAALTLPSASRIERQGGLRRPAPSVGLAQCRLGALEVAAEPADVADRVEAVGLGRRRVEGAELGRRPLELLLRALPGAADGRHLGAMDPADAREARRATGVAVLLGRLDPFARPPVVREVAARSDHPTGGDAAS